MLPTPDEVQNDQDNAENFPEWNKSRWKMFEEPKLLIQALDEPYTPAAMAAAGNNSLGITTGDLDESAKKTNEQEMAMEQERTKAKIAVAKAKPRPTVSRKDGFLNSTFVQVKKDTVERVVIKQSLDHNWVASLIRAQMHPTIGRLVTAQLLAFRKGYAQIGSIEDERFAIAIKLARISLQERAERFIHRLTEGVISSLRRHVKEDTDNKSQVTRAVFDSVEFRTRFIEDVEIRKAETFGRAIAMRNLQGRTSVSSITTNDNACAKCQSRDGQTVFLGLLTLDDVPPHHAHCNCLLQEPKAPDTLVQDLAGTPPPGPGEATNDMPENPAEGVPSIEKSFAACTECGKTALRTKGTPDIFNCKACGHSFRVLQDDDEDLDDAHATPLTGSGASKYLKCRKRTRALLKAAHPDWTRDRIISSAEAACSHLLVTDDSDDPEEIDQVIEDATLIESLKKGK